VVGGKGEWSPGELRRVLPEHAGLDVTAVRAAGGESRCAFWVTDRAGAVSVLKIMPGAPPEVAGQLHALNTTLARLRDRGYPAPRLTAIGFTPANLLCDGNAITGVIDINPLTLAGDRAFDLATMLFYYYDRDEIRGPLRG
jgi:hypothetical protein